jgi:hypothetical protein
MLLTSVPSAAGVIEFSGDENFITRISGGGIPKLSHLVHL